METFLAFLRALLDSNIEPLQGYIQNTPQGLHSHEMTLTFSAADEARIAGVMDELEELHLEPERISELVVIAVVGEMHPAPA